MSGEDLAMPEFERMDVGELARTNARTLIRIEVDLVALNVKIDGLVGDHEARIRALERYMYLAIGSGLAGAAAGVGALLRGL